VALSDVYQLIDHQQYINQDIENVWFFEKLDPAGTAADLIQAFITDLLPAVRQIQGSGFYHAFVDCLNLGDLGDFDTEVTNVFGTAGGGDLLPSFNAVGYSLKPATRAVRPGSKRFAGILEAVVTNGAITEPTFVANVEALRIKLDDNVVGALSEYQPVIVKRIKYVPDPEKPDHFAYRLPTAGDPLVLGLVKQAVTNPEVTSQVSRKI